MGILVGVDIGGTKTTVVLGRTRLGGLDILDRTQFPTEPRTRSWHDVVRDIIGATGQMRARVEMPPGAAGGLGGAPLEGIGVSCGGPLDSRAGLIQSPPNLPGWDNVPVIRELERGLGSRAFLQNDANACALAEWRFGAGRGTRNMVFLTFGTGMGAGLILDGRLYEGTNDLAGEVGHVRLAEEGPTGYGKTGTFEAFCSGGGIAALARAAVEKRLDAGQHVGFCAGRESLALITAQAVGEAAETGDAAAREILALSGKFLGRGVAMIIDILNPQRIVIGSIFARCRRFLQPAMEKEISGEALTPAARACEVVPAALGERIGEYACLTVAVACAEGADNGSSR